MRKEKKRCSKCRKIKSIEDFWKLKSSPDGRAYWCVRCAKEYREARSRAPEKLWRQRLFEEVLKHYGGRCSCCREREPTFLRLLGPKKPRAWLPWWLKRHKFPEGFRVLCHNCAHALSSHGYCPHQPAI